MSDGSTSDWQTLFPQLLQSGSPLVHSVQEISLPADTVAFRQGDTVANYLLVIEGSVKVLARSESGREIVLYRVRRGSSCVLTTSCLLGQSRYPAEGITETAVRALAIPAAAFHRELADSPGFQEFVFRTYSQRLVEIISLVEEISFGHISQRLASYLLQHARGGALNTTHQALATELGSAREVISRRLKEFEQHGWIKQHRGQIDICNTEALQRLVTQSM